jgi:hypothetical protein
MSTRRLRAIRELPAPLRPPRCRRGADQLPSWSRCPRTSRQRSRASTDFAAVPVTRGGRFYVETAPRGSTGRIRAAMREASDRARVRPARVIGRRPRMSTRCASVRESLRNISAADPPRPRPDRRGRQSVPHGAGRRCAGRAPTASGHDHRQAGRDRLIPVVPRVVRTSPRVRRPPNQRRPGVPPASPHGANRNAQRETGPARRLPARLRAQTHEHPDA